MNLIPTIFSIALAASVSIFYLQNQKDEPTAINYRVALTEFEEATIKFAQHTPLNNPNINPPIDHCSRNMSFDFSDKLPKGNTWRTEITGLDCDIAKLSVTIPPNSSNNDEDFYSLIKAATASERINGAIVDYNQKTLTWTQRLYSRKPYDLGIMAKLKNNKMGLCWTCVSADQPSPGGWSEWDACPTDIPCGKVEQKRYCTKPAPKNNGAPCERGDGSLTSASNNFETRDCQNITPCGQWSNPIACPTNDCLTSLENQPILKTCLGPERCKDAQGKLVAVGHGITCNIMSCGQWSQSSSCEIKVCVRPEEKNKVKRTCLGPNICKDNFGAIYRQGKYEVCDTTKMVDCGIWTEPQACTQICLNPGEKAQPKRQCLRYDCKEADGKVTVVGNYEFCDVDLCGKLITKNCPTTPTCLLSPDQKDIVKLKCDGPNHCKDANGNRLVKGYQETCGIKSCGTWDEWSKPDKSKKCLSAGEKQPVIKRLCEGINGCKDDMGNFYPFNTMETQELALPTCGQWTERKACPSTCLYEGQPDFVIQTCIGPNPCNDNGNLVDVGYKKRCETKSCGIWSEWKLPNSTKNCLQIGEDQPIKTRFCQGENGCKDDFGIFYPFQAVETVKLELPTCGQWGEWTKCTLYNDGISDVTIDSCKDKAGMQTRTCIGGNCPEGLDARQCYTESCQISINNSIDTTYLIMPEVKNAANRRVEVIIEKPSLFGAPSTDTCAINTGGPYKQLTITNYGRIHGHGGSGGDGAEPTYQDSWWNNVPSGILSYEYSELVGKDGKDGGDAICIESNNVTIINKDGGVLTGGKGGGGGGGGTCMANLTGENCVSGGKGGQGFSFDHTLVKGKPGQHLHNSETGKAGKGGNGGFLLEIKNDEIKASTSESRHAQPGEDATHHEFTFFESLLPVYKTWAGRGGKAGNDGNKCKNAKKFKNIKGCN